MKVLFEQKRELQIDEVNREAESGSVFAEESERMYEERIAAAAARIEESGCRVVMLSGPSGSGKTTSSLKLAKALRARGRPAEVISLDDFFINIEDYPERPDGSKDLESIYALDIALVNGRLHDLVNDGRAEIPQFDFPNQRRGEKPRLVELGKDGVAIVEGIHALNPLLTHSISRHEAFLIYAGLREEYYHGGKRMIATRDLRIARRLVRDFYFRGYSVERTLNVWDGILEGEEVWVKVFKPKADMLLDTSFCYEACVFRPLLERLFADEAQGGAKRHRLEVLVKRFLPLLPVEEALVPKNSMLREFLGGLVL